MFSPWGIEEEFAIVDPKRGNCARAIQEILEDGKVTLKEQIKPEMHQSVVELGTEICRDRDAREHVVGLRSKLAALARARSSRSRRPARIRFRIGTINSSLKASAIRKSSKTCNARPRQSHLRVACACRNSGSGNAIHVMNQARYFLPHIYALSVNSPFWVGQEHRLKRLSPKSV